MTDQNKTVKEFHPNLHLTAYPAIGSQVEYIRHDMKEEKVINGTGAVHAICLDPRKRLMVHVRETDKKGVETAYNIDINCLFPTPEFRAEFVATTKRVKELSKMGNEKSKAIVDEHNNLIAEAYTDILGEPIVIGE